MISMLSQQCDDTADPGLGPAVNELTGAEQ